MSPSEIAFLAVGLILGAGVGAAVVEALRARPAPGWPGPRSRSPRTRSGLAAGTRCPRGRRRRPAGPSPDRPPTAAWADDHDDPAGRPPAATPETDGARRPGSNARSIDAGRPARRRGRGSRPGRDVDPRRPGRDDARAPRRPGRDDPERAAAGVRDVPSHQPSPSWTSAARRRRSPPQPLPRPATVSAVDVGPTAPGVGRAAAAAGGPRAVAGASPRAPRRRAGHATLGPPPPPRGRRRAGRADGDHAGIRRSVRRPAPAGGRALHRRVRGARQREGGRRRAARGPARVRHPARAPRPCGAGRRPARGRRREGRAPPPVPLGERRRGVGRGGRGRRPRVARRDQRPQHPVARGRALPPDRRGGPAAPRARGSSGSRSRPTPPGSAPRAPRSPAATPASGSRTARRPRRAARARPADRRRRARTRSTRPGRGESRVDPDPAAGRVASRCSAGPAAARHPGPARRPRGPRPARRDRSRGADPEAVRTWQLRLTRARRRDRGASDRGRLPRPARRPPVLGPVHVRRAARGRRRALGARLPLRRAGRVRGRPGPGRRATWRSPWATRGSTGCGSGLAARVASRASCTPRRRSPRTSGWRTRRTTCRWAGWSTRWAPGPRTSPTSGTPGAGCVRRCSRRTDPIVAGVRPGRPRRPSPARGRAAGPRPRRPR